MNEYAIRHSLMRAYERDLGAAGSLALTLKTLSRSDRDRLAYFDGSRVIRHSAIENLWRDGEVEAVTIQVAAETSGLSACIGYAVEDGCRPEASAWLLDRDGRIIDVAGRRRDALGFLGVALRATEVARWTPTQPHAVAISDLARSRAA